jgi:hypothetical protein
MNIAKPNLTIPPHFRSFSLDSHLNQYNMVPTTSQNITTLSNTQPTPPPNETEENHSRPGDNGPSPTDSDASHSYHDDVPQNYAHQVAYQGVSPGHTNLSVASGDLASGEKQTMTMLQQDSLRKEYLTSTTMLDPSLMSQGWSYH